MLRVRTVSKQKSMKQHVLYVTITWSLLSRLLISSYYMQLLICNPGKFTTVFLFKEKRYKVFNYLNLAIFEYFPFVEYCTSKYPSVLVLI